MSETADPKQPPRHGAGDGSGSAVSPDGPARSAAADGSVVTLPGAQGAPGRELPPPAPRRRLADFHVTDTLQNLKSIAVNLLMVFSVLLALPLAYKIVARNSLTINEFTVPGSVGERGISGKVLAQRLHDEILAASRFTSRQIERQGSTPVALEEKLPKIDLPVEGLNLAILVPQLRSLFGFRDASIAGELIVEQAGGNGQPEKYGLRLRARGEGAIFRSDSPSDNIDQLLRDAAIIVLQREDPIVAAYYYLFRRDFKAARRMADLAAISDDPKTRLLATHVKGLVARGVNDWAAAAEHFRAVITINPDFRAGYSNLAAVARRVDIVEADAVVSDMVARFPDYWLSYTNLAFVRLNQRRVPDAKEAMVKALAVAPRDPEVLYHKQFFERAIGEYEAAIATLQLAQDLNPMAIHYFEEMARMRRDLGQLPEALAAAGRIAAVEPGNPLGHAIVARILLDMKDYGRAEEAIRKALAIESDFPPALAERIRLHTLRAQWREADMSFMLAEQSDPRLSETWEYRGDLLVLQNRAGDAIAAYRQAVAFGIFPGWRAADPSAKLGKLLEASGDRPAALEAYERAIRLDRRKYAHLTAEIERLKGQVEGTAQPESPAARSN